MIWGYPYFWKHPYISNNSANSASVRSDFWSFDFFFVNILYRVLWSLVVLNQWNFSWKMFFFTSWYGKYSVIFWILVHISYMSTGPKHFHQPKSLLANPWTSSLGGFVSQLFCFSVFFSACSSREKTRELTSRDREKTRRRTPPRIWSKCSSTISILAGHLASRLAPPPHHSTRWIQAGDISIFFSAKRNGRRAWISWKVLLRMKKTGKFHRISSFFLGGVSHIYVSFFLLQGLWLSFFLTFGRIIASSKLVFLRSLFLTGSWESTYRWEFPVGICWMIFSEALNTGIRNLCTLKQKKMMIYWWFWGLT